MKKITIALALLFATVTLTSQIAIAEEKSNDEKHDNTLVVTADKRSKSILEVPMTLSAFSAEDLEASGITDIIDLTAAAPGLSASQSSAGGGSLYIRGIGSNLSGAGADPSIAMYRDGVYVARHVVAFQDFIDVERVEVLRGPQGTLYGRNATGGAINIISKKPSQDFAATLRMEAGDYGLFATSAAITGGLTENLAARTSVSFRERDNYSYNPFRQETLKQVDSIATNTSFLWSNDDDTEVLFRFDYEEDDGLGVIAGKHLVNSFTPSGYGGTLEAEILPDLFENNQDYDTSNNHLETYGVSLDIGFTLGDVQVKMITGYRDIETNIAYDTDFTELPNGFSEVADNSEMITQEVTFSSSEDEKFEWMVGGFVYDEKASQIFDANFNMRLSTALLNGFDGVLVPDPFFSLLPAGTDVHLEGVTAITSKNRTKAHAVFGEVAYNVSDQLKLTLGLRYSSEKKSHDTSAGAMSALNEVATALTRAGLDPALVDIYDYAVLFLGGGYSELLSNADTKSWDAITPRFVVEYEYSDSILLYGSVSKGFKSGGFNSSDTAPLVTTLNQQSDPEVVIIDFQPPFEPENIINYEVGLKGRSTDGKLAGSVSVYHYNYEDLQVRFVDSVGGFLPVENAGSANVTGLEIEGYYIPVEDFQLDAQVSYTDSEYDSFTAASASDARTGAPLDLTGRELDRAPKLKVNLGAEYSSPVGDSGSLLVLRVEYQHSDDMWLEQTMDPVAKTGGYDTFNARATWVFPGDNWTLSLWGRNISDENYISTSIYNNLQGYNIVNSAPRTYGVSVGYDF